MTIECPYCVESGCPIQPSLFRHLAHGTCGFSTTGCRVLNGLYIRLRRTEPIVSTANCLHLLLASALAINLVEHSH